MSTGNFNIRKIRREAHRLSRHNSGAWNPFGFSFGGNGGKSKTWTVGDQEAQPVSNGESTSEPAAQVQTAPATPNSRHGQQDAPHGLRKETGVAGERLQPSSGGSGVDTHDQQLLRRKTSSKETSPTAGEAVMAQAPKVRKNRTFFKHVEPKEPFTVGNQLRRSLLGSWINILILAAPVGIALHFVPSIGGVVVFVVNFIAIIPLAAMLSFATEEIALRTGETLGGLLNATFGNAVELIIAVIALAKNEVVIVQTSLVGSILSNLLLVMGMCFFFGGLRRQEQYFNTTVAQTAASLLALAVASVIVPTVFDRATANTGLSEVSKLSRGTSIILLFVYGGYLFFQLKTHSSVFAQESQKVAAKPWKSLQDGAVSQAFVRPAGIMGGHVFTQQQDQAAMQERLNTPPDGGDEAEEPQLHFWVAVALLASSTVIIAICAEFMVDGIGAVTNPESGISQEFVGLILLPIVGNAAEHATAVTVAIKDKMDLAIGVAVGSSMQVALFLIPLLVVLGWIMGKEDMNLSFDIFQVAVLFVAVLLVNYLIADGKSHWLEGQLLICLYVIIAICAFFYPNAE